MLLSDAGEMNSMQVETKHPHMFAEGEADCHWHEVNFICPYIKKK